MQSFGGPWTRTKIEVLKKYLEAYMALMTKNFRARFFKKIYVDAFAGSGEVYLRTDRMSGISGTLGDEAVWPIEGSARMALSLPLKFDEYLFIEKRRRNVELLKRLRDEHSEIGNRIRIEHGDSNQYLCEWVASTDWKKCRALVFLDPFALQVDFKTIEALGRSKGVDLWLLFPLSAVNRVLVRKGKPVEKWKERLNRFFGTDEWEREFYQTGAQPDLFTGTAQDEKAVTPEGVTKYFNRRLREHFAQVVEEPMVLKNSAGSDLFVLMFASANPKGAPTAIRIARDIIQKALREQQETR